MDETTTNGFARPTPPEPPASDPFYYGWRDVRQTLPDGRVLRQQIPLTLKDHLYPEEGDHFMEGSQHDRERGYLRDVFRTHLASDPQILVLSDQGVYWGGPDPCYHHSPDVCVIFGVREQRENWPSFQVAEQGVRPTLIVEIVSPRYRVNDVGEKFREYYQLNIPWNAPPWRLRPVSRPRPRPGPPPKPACAKWRRSCAACAANPDRAPVPMGGRMPARPDYGIDAPYVVRNLLLAGAGCIGAATLI